MERGGVGYGNYPYIEGYTLRRVAGDFSPSQNPV